MHRRRGDLLAALPGGLIVAAALIVQLPADPAPGMTLSDSPWTDEAWSVLGARNLALLGTWVTDDLAMYLVQLPFNLAVAAVFEIFGVGIIQARTVAVACSIAAVVLTAVLVARVFGRLSGAVAGIALATSALLLYYGRLAYLEPMVACFLAAALALLLLTSGSRARLVLGALAGVSLAIAVGTKPSAIAAGAGILVGASLATYGSAERFGRPAAVAAAVVGVFGTGWILLVGLPQRDAVEAAFRFWPPQSLPESPWEWVVRVGRYVRASDGANTLTLPLYAGAAGGLWLSVRSWRVLEPRQRALVGAAVGWVAFGLLLIVVTAYRPNRYVVPLLPGLAILVGVGVGLAAARWGASSHRRLIVAVGGAALLAAPGLLLWASWTASATRELPGIQAEVAGLIDGSGAVQGGQAPALAMRAAVPAVVSIPRRGINDGDLYAELGVRWLIADETFVPHWAGLHPEAWENRQTVRCFPYGEDRRECLIRVP